MPQLQKKLEIAYFQEQFAEQLHSWAKCTMRQRGHGLNAWCGSAEMG